MTEADLMDLLTKSSEKEALEALAAHPQTERRKHGKAVVKLFRLVESERFSRGPKTAPALRDPNALTIALFATATLTDLKKLGFLPFQGTIPLTEIVRRLEPDWTQAYVDHLVEENPNFIHRVAPLWQAGLCARPESDAVILGYYTHFNGDPEEERVLLGGDVWRFFEVEGGGEFSLANHDKFAKPGAGTWCDRLLAYAEAGQLDRQRLLDASLDALERDFGQYRAGWYSRFHTALNPTAEERTVRAPRYLRLLASSVPPTVSFAVKTVQALDKAKAIDPADMLTGLEPALQARSKGTVSAALALVARAAARAPELSGQAASCAVLALVSEDAGVQGKALDLIEKLGKDAGAELWQELAAYVPHLAPSVRARAAALAGGETDVAPLADPVRATSTAAPVEPVASADEALSLHLAMLEDPRDPFDVERAIDGLARFGAALRDDATRLSPLAKRARQIKANPGPVAVRAVLGLTGCAWADGAPVLEALGSADTEDALRDLRLPPLARFHIRRNAEAIQRVLDGLSLPLLALPSDTSGTVAVTDLKARLAEYDKAGVAPGAADLALALMRLSPDGRAAEAPQADASEAERALAYAQGAEVPVGPTPEIWAAAWRTRQPVQADPAVSALFAAHTPGCGTPTTAQLCVRRQESPDGAYFWVDVEVPVSPDLPGQADVLPALYEVPPSSHGASYADVAWASLTMPSDPESFYRAGILHQDTWQKLTDNYTRAYLDPFFRPGGAVGPLGAGLLAYDMACEDKSVSSLAADAAASLLLESRLSEDLLSAALTAFLMSGSLPTTRWTKALAAMAQSGAEQHVRGLIEALLSFEPEETPKDIGGMLELLYELHIAAGTAPARPSTITCLERIKGGGKVAKFSKKLLELAKNTALLSPA